MKREENLTGISRLSGEHGRLECLSLPCMSSNIAKQLLFNMEGILADQMGSGKSMITLALIAGTLPSLVNTIASNYN